MGVPEKKIKLTRCQRFRPFLTRYGGGNFAPTCSFFFEGDASVRVCCLGCEAVTLICFVQIPVRGCHALTSDAV